MKHLLKEIEQILLLVLSRKDDRVRLSSDHGPFSKLESYEKLIHKSKVGLKVSTRLLKACEVYFICGHWAQMGKRILF